MSSAPRSPAPNNTSAPRRRFGRARRSAIERARRIAGGDDDRRTGARTRLELFLAMDPFVFAAVLFAAACHAGWNATIKRGLDPLATTVAISLGAALVSLVAVPVAGL